LKALTGNVAIPPEEEAVVDLGLSPKIVALMDAIAEMEGDEKGVIYSQWTSYLDIIQQVLQTQGHGVCRIDGSMTTEERTEALASFNDNDDIRFILCSLKAAGVGISLKRGNVVFMMDCWWNVATEDQAMQRVHRVGQTRPVRCIRLVMKDSIEERMIKVQQAKSALGKGSMERLSRDEERVAKLTAMKDLLEIKDDEEDYDESEDFWKF